jgi:predicted lipoprotein
LRADGEKKAPKNKLKLVPAKELEGQMKHQQEKTCQTNNQKQKIKKQKQKTYQTWRESQHTGETNAQKRARYLLLFPDKKTKK